MKLRNLLPGIVLLTFLGACNTGDDSEASMHLFSETFDFNESDYQWKAGFADFPANAEDSAKFQLHYAYTDQPAGSLLTKKSVLLSGNNLNGDLFMYLKRRVTGLAPNTDYTITFNIELASNLNSSLDNAHGSVCLKAGATHLEPRSMIEGGKYVMNIDKGDGIMPGEDMISLGDIRSAVEMSGYVTISRNNIMANSRYVAKTNSNGELWLIIGTDSTLPTTITILYSKVSVVLSAS